MMYVMAIAAGVAMFGFAFYLVIKGTLAQQHIDWMLQKLRIKAKKDGL